MSLWNDPFLSNLFLKATPLIDVRAPIEFASGAIPNSVNLPLMTNEERALVGTRYKEAGQAEAIKLGHELVGGKVKEERVEKWIEYINQNPGCQVFCFRGGLRSQISCQWLRERGLSQYPLEGGYKRLRQFFLSWLEEATLPRLYRLGGLTGTGKTGFLTSLSYSIDIEGLAHHRGSAFGGHSLQPTQITFENKLAAELLKHQNSPLLLLEDESATLGQITIPLRFFSALRQAPLVVLEVSHERRLQNIFQDYVKDSCAEFFLQGLLKIKKRLSNTDYDFLVQEISRAFSLGFKLQEHEAWISLLLKQYYDPLYQKDLKRNAEHIVFQGDEQAVREYLTSLNR